MILIKRSCNVTKIKNQIHRNVNEFRILQPLVEGRAGAAYILVGRRRAVFGHRGRTSIYKLTAALKDVRRKISRYWAAEFLNVRQQELSVLLNITQSAVSMAAGRGPEQTEELKMNFEI